MTEEEEKILSQLALGFRRSMEELGGRIGRGLCWCGVWIGLGLFFAEMIS